MTDLSGLPDFASVSPSGTMFAPLGSGSFTVLPQQLALGTNADGTPKFTLELIQRFGDFTPAGQYAVLDLSLTGDFGLDAALTAARAQSAGATVAPIAIAGGFARLFPTAGEVTPASDALAPVELGLSGQDYARWTTRLSADAGELIKGAIAGGSLLLGARVEFDVAGVAPRVAATVDFQAAQLLSALLAGRPDRTMSISDVVAAFTGPPASFPLKIAGGAVPAGDFAAAVASRLFATYATLAPAPSVSDEPFVRFADPSQLGVAVTQWDLSQPAPGRRQYVLTLDILTGLRAWVAKNGLASLVRDLTVPMLQVGTHSIDFNANLPPNRQGVAVIGANVEVAANPPSRPSSISQTVTFEEPNDSGSLQFQLSPSEQLAYTLAGFAVVAVGPDVAEYQMPPRPHTDVWVQLGADDFPVAFAHVTAAPRLLALATLDVALTYTVGGRSERLRATLNAQTSGVALALPRTATGASLSITANAIDGGATLQLPPAAPARIDLDVTAFREFGPHRVAISASLRPGDHALFLDLAPEDGAAAGATPDRIFLTADQPSATWGYVASSPFHAGYRYRTSAAQSSAAGAWSAILSPFVPLALERDGTPAALVSAAT
ncbi:MAG TPA: hypothetical protein VIW73_09120 [Candidatus Cybelea sp.]